MKLSIWQQFSSNHSSSFTVVGQFETVEKAQDVETIFRMLFEAIQEARGFDSRGYDEDFISWPEHEAGQIYGIAWEKGIDWLGDDLSEHIIRFENNVFVTNALSATRQYPTVLPDLMKHFTSEVYAEGGYEFHDTILLTSLECRYPNDQVGRTIMEDLHLYLNPKTIEFAISPWEQYSSYLRPPYTTTDGIHGSYQEILRRPIHTTLPVEIIRQITQTLYEYQRAVMSGHLMQPAMQHAINALKQLEEHDYTFPLGLTEAVVHRIAQSIGGVSNTGALGGRVERIGLSIHIPEIAFFRTEYGLPSLVAYLQDHGCEDIRYSFSSVPYTSRREYM